MTSTLDLLTAISTHLGAFDLPAIASVHVSASLPGPQIAVQLSCPGPSTLAQVTAEAWRVPQGDSVHLLLTGLLSDGTSVLVYGVLPACRGRCSTDWAPGATTTVPLAALRHVVITQETRD